MPGYLDLDGLVYVSPGTHHGELKRSQLRTSDVLLTITGVSYGKAAYVPSSLGEANINQHSVRMALKPDVLPEYVAMFLNCRFGRLQTDRKITGGTRPALDYQEIRSIQIPVPPLHEQEAIRSILQASEQQRSYARNLYTQAQALLTAELGLDRLDLSEGLYSVRRASEALQAERIDAEHFRPKYYRVMDALEALKPKALVPLGSLASTLTNGHTPLHHSLDVGEILFLTAEHVFDFRINFDSDKRILVEHHETELARTQLREGDVLITIKGRVGNAAVVEHLFTPTNINQDVALLRLKPGYHPYYIAGFLNSAAGKALTEQVCTGQINPFLGLGNLSQVLIPIFEEARMTELGQELQQKVEQAYQARQGAKRLLAEARTEVERMIAGAQTCQVSKT